MDMLQSYQCLNKLIPSICTNAGNQDQGLLSNRASHWIEIFFFSTMVPTVLVIASTNTFHIHTFIGYFFLKLRVLLKLDTIKSMPK